MCDVAPETVLFRPNLADIAIIHDSILVLMPKSAFGLPDHGEPQTKESGYTAYSGLQEQMPSIKDLIQNNAKYIRMFEPPKISESFRTKLRISSEIGAILVDDQEFKYALYNIFNLIDKSFTSIKLDYHVDVALDTDQDLPNWKRANIIVGIHGMDYQSILNLWDNIGSEVGNYLKSLGRNPIFPHEKALSFYNFINISFTPEGHICQ